MVPTLSTTTLPDGEQNVAYLALIEGQVPEDRQADLQILQGELPEGVELGAIERVGATVRANLAGTPRVWGNFSIVVALDDGEGGRATRSLSLKVVADALQVARVDTAQLVVGEASTTSFSVAGGRPPYTWSVSAGDIPPGTELSPGTSGAQLVGTPEQHGLYPITLIVEDTSGLQAELTTEIDVLPLVLSIRTSSLAEASLDFSYRAVLATAGGSGADYRWEVVQGDLPQGLSLTPGIPDAAIEGTPTLDEDASFTIQVTDDAGQTATASYDLSVVRPLSITTTQLADAQVDVSFDQVLEAVGGRGDYQWSITAGQLPAGITLLSSGPTSGFLSGIPTESGDFDFEVQVADIHNRTATAAFRLHVNPALIAEVTALALRSCETASVSLAALSGSGSGYQWSIVSGTLPPGLVLTDVDSRVAHVVGTPYRDAAGTHAVSFEVTDDAGGRAEVQFNLQIAPGDPKDSIFQLRTRTPAPELVIADLCGPLPAPRRTLPIAPFSGGAPMSGNIQMTITPDGRYLAYVADLDVQGADHLYVADLSSAVPTVVRVSRSATWPVDYGVSSPAFSPDGRKLAFNVYGNGDVGEVHVVDISSGVQSDSSSVVLSNTGVFFLELRFSPDSRRLAVRESGSLTDAMWVSDVEGAPQPALLVSDSLAPIGVPRNFSWVNASTLLYREDSRQPTERLLAHDLGVLPPPAAVVLATTPLSVPVFGDSFGVLPGGSDVWFASDRRTPGVSELFQVSLGNPGVVTPMHAPLPGGPGIEQVQPQPGGPFLAVVSESASQEHAYLMDTQAIGAALIPMTSLVGQESSFRPTWSNDGRFVVVATEDTNRMKDVLLTEVATMRSQLILPAMPRLSSSISSFSPDGRHLVIRGFVSPSSLTTMLYLPLAPNWNATAVTTLALPTSSQAQAQIRWARGALLVLEGRLQSATSEALALDLAISGSSFEPLVTGSTEFNTALPVSLD